MRTQVSNVLRWVRRADGTRRTPGWLGAPSDPLACRGAARAPGEIDLSAPATLDILDPSFQLETFCLETFGTPDVIPHLTGGTAASAASERELDPALEEIAMRRDIEQIGSTFRAGQ